MHAKGSMSAGGVGFLGGDTIVTSMYRVGYLPSCEGITINIIKIKTTTELGY
jgi:hypothetical protein